MDVELWMKLFEANGSSVITKYILLVLLSICILITKIEPDKENIKVKISILFVLFYILAVVNLFSILSLTLIFLILTFVFFEIILVDDLKRKILKKRRYLIYDYFYKMIFEYKTLYFFAGFIIYFLWIALDKYLKYILIKINIYNLLEQIKLFNITSYNIYIFFIKALPILIVFKGIINMLNDEFETYNFEEINEEMKKIMSFEGFGPNAKLHDFGEILTHKEDKSFFIRKNNYNWLSISFIKYRIKRIFMNFSKRKYSKGKKIKNICNIGKTIITYTVRFIKLSIKFVKKTIQIIVNVLIRRENIKNYLRGYSTIEMQLIRTIALKHGYETKTIQRKFYELIYSEVFFRSLKEFYEYHQYSNTEYYKYYILYIYIRVAPVRINGVDYYSILKMFNKKKLNNITNEEFFIWTYGLSYWPVDMEMLKDPSLDIFNINKTKLKNLIKKFEVNKKTNT